MIGVVLWCDTFKNRAVIWCEDHGDLAFYKTDPYAGPIIHDGDCVSFRLERDGDLRLATELTVLAEESHPELAAFLSSIADVQQEAQDEGMRKQLQSTGEMVAPCDEAEIDAPVGNLIPFPGGRRAPRKNTARRNKACRVVHVS